MLASFARRAETLSEDHIMDQIDGDPPERVEVSRDEQENLVNKKRKGCNKHFKDELLLKGWSLKECTGHFKERPAWCLEQLGRAVKESEVDTYSVKNEAAFYACERTVGQYGQELAASLAEQVEDGKDLNDAIKVACREAARCNSKAKAATGKAKRRKAAESSGTTPEDRALLDCRAEQRQARHDLG